MTKKSFALPGAMILLLAGGLYASRATATSVTAADEETQLATSMEEMEDAIRSLRKSLRSAEQSSTSLSNLLVLQKAVTTAKIQTPAMTESLPAEERPAFVLGFRKEMINMSRMLLDLEEFVLDGKLEEAGELFKKIRRLEDGGHERYTEDG
jgi:soluble cytochrome b562